MHDLNSSSSTTSRKVMERGNSATEQASCRRVCAATSELSSFHLPRMVDVGYSNKCDSFVLQDEVSTYIED